MSETVEFKDVEEIADELNTNPNTIKRITDNSLRKQRIMSGLTDDPRGESLMRTAVAVEQQSDTVEITLDNDRVRIEGQQTNERLVIHTDDGTIEHKEPEEETDEQTDSDDQTVEATSQEELFEIIDENFESLKEQGDVEWGQKEQQATMRRVSADELDDPEALNEELEPDHVEQRPTDGGGLLEAFVQHASDDWLDQLEKEGLVGPHLYTEYDETYHKLEAGTAIVREELDAQDLEQLDEDEVRHNHYVAGSPDDDYIGVPEPGTDEAKQWEDYDASSKPRMAVELTEELAEQLETNEDGQIVIEPSWDGTQTGEVGDILMVNGRDEEGDPKGYINRQYDETYDSKPIDVDGSLDDELDKQEEFEALSSQAQAILEDAREQADSREQYEKYASEVWKHVHEQNKGALSQEQEQFGRGE